MLAAVHWRFAGVVLAMKPSVEIRPEFLQDIGGHIDAELNAELGAGVAGGPTEQRVAMAPISFNEIAGWGEDKQSEALAAFRRSCPKLTAGPDSKITTDGGTKTITPAEWKRICDSASCCRKSRDGWSRRNTKSGPAWDSI